jgi:subtilisin family serine protease
MNSHRTSLFTLLVLLLLIASYLALGQGGRLPDAGHNNVSKRVDLGKGPKYVPGEVLVRFKPGTSRRAMLSSHARVGGMVKREFKSVPGLHLVKLSAEANLKRALRDYHKDPNVLYAEPNYVVHPFTLPNDPLFPQQWGLSNTGQGGGTSGADIHAQQAWDITTGLSNVVVAVIDTGIDYNHPDLATNIWSAPTPFTQAYAQYNYTCPAGSHGYSPAPGSPDACDPMDLDGHGTHVAGIIGAVGNNGLGVSGVNWNVQLMACNFTGALDAVDGAVACLDFVKDMKDQGVNIIATNNSWGGTELYSQALIDAIAAQQQDGILFIAAAGNSFQDNDLVPTDPASLFLANIISVAATTRNDDLVAFSNFGRYSVDLGAPGVDILSTLPGGVYGLDTGTSMSAPFVTGVAALLKAANPSWDWRTIRNQILAGGDTLAALANTVTGRRLNAYGALTCSNSTVASRLQPTMVNTAGAVGAPTTLAYLNINCGQPNGPVSVQSSSGDIITLQDDGTGADQAAGDGIYSGQWTPQALGSYALTFPGGDAVNVQVLSNYIPSSVPASDYSYRNISGTNLNLGDDSVATVTSPFPIEFGGGSFNNLYVSSNGTISFTDVFGGFVDVWLPNNANYQAYSTLATLVAPFWEDLYPVSGSNNNVFWEVTGTAPNRELVIEWRDVESYACRGDSSATVKFQVVFQEGSSNVLFNYADTMFGGNCADEDKGGEAEVGILVAPTLGTTWSCDEPDIGDGTGILWTLPSGSPASNPVPVINSISPASVPLGGPDFVVTVTGSNFIPQSRVEANSLACPTTYVSSTELQGLVPASDIQLSYGIGMDVYNPPPGGGRSASSYITVTGQAPAPVITALNPSSTTAGGFSFDLEVDGSNFIFGTSTVQWNGAAVTTTYIGPNKLVGVIVANLIANPGTAQITVNNLSAGGASNAVPFTITAPTAQSQVPASAKTGKQNPGGNGTPGGSPGAIQLPKYLPRFLGWNIARKEGPEYVQRFLRPHAATALPSVSPKSGNVASSPRPNATSQSLSPSALPGFQFRPSIIADFMPTSVATGDFNHDGRMDWVVANGGANSLWLYLGKGDGTAQPPIIIPLKGQAPVAVAAADLRGGGNLDLIVAEADSGEVGVLLGNGDGTFGIETTYYVPGAPLCLLVDDFNGDGRKDILVGMAGNVNVGEIALLPGDGGGRFGPPVYRPYEHAYVASSDILLANNVVEADLNGDGFPDLVVNDINPVTPGVYAYLNQKDGTFKLSQEVDSPGFFRDITSLALGDVNGDGCADLIDTGTDGLAELFLGNCDGTFQNPFNGRQLALGDVAVEVVLADVNGDGKLDIVAAGGAAIIPLIYGDQPGNAVSVLLGDGQGNFSNAKIYRGWPSMYSLALADLNGDGHPDIVAASQDADLVAIFLNDGSGGFGMPEGGNFGFRGYGNSSPPNLLNPSFKIADVNGDGKPDLVLLEFSNDYIEAFNLTVFLNDGSGNFSNPIRSHVIDEDYGTSGAVGDVALGDFRHTGLPDFVAVGSPSDLGSSYIAFAKNNGDGTFTPLPLAKPSGAQGLIGVGDFNGDGKLDFVVVAPVLGAPESMLTVFLGNGDGTFTPGYSTTFATTDWPGKVWVGDFNGDGKLDVLVHVIGNSEGTLGQDVYEFLGRGDGTFAPAKDVLPNVGDMAVGDLNHDGIDDIVEIVEPLTTFADYIPLQYAIYLGQPDGSFKLTNTYQPYAGLSVPTPGLTLADFNGDGNLDIAAFQTFPSYVENPSLAHTFLQILAGNGDGTFTPTYTTFDFDQILVPQFTADLNGDGKADLVELAGYGGSFNVVPATLGPSLQVRLVSTPIIGSTGTARVTLAVASSADTAIQLAASDPAISIPASVTIPSGSVSQDVPFQIGSGFNSQHVFTINASLGTQTATAYGWQANGSLAEGFTMWLANSSQTAFVAQASGDYGLNIASINNYATTVQSSCTGLPAWATCQFSAPALTIPAGTSSASSLVVATTSAAQVGTYQFTVIATDGTITRQVAATLQVQASPPPNILGVISPASATLSPGQSANLEITLISENSAAGTLSLQCSGIPSGSTCSFNPTTTTLPANGSVTDQLTVQVGSAVQIGTYPFSVVATVGSITNQIAVTLQVQGPPDFSGAISPASATVTVGQSASFAINLISQNDATGNVNLQCLNIPSGTACTFNPTVPSLPANDNVTDQLTVQASSAAQVGTYPFTVLATLGTITHQIAATLQVQESTGPPNFSGSISPTSATLSAGQSANFSITLNSQNGASGSVSFQCLNVPSGTTCTFNPTTANLPANGNASDTLTVQVNSRPAVAPPVTSIPWSRMGGWLGALPFLAGLLLATFVIVAASGGREQRLAALVVLLLTAASLLVATLSCGGGGSTVSGPPPPAPVAFTITVQASGAGVSTPNNIGSLTITVN